MRPVYSDGIDDTTDVVRRDHGITSEVTNGRALTLNGNSLVPRASTGQSSNPAKNPGSSNSPPSTASYEKKKMNREAAMYGHKQLPSLLQHSKEAQQQERDEKVGRVQEIFMKKVGFDDFYGPGLPGESLSDKLTREARMKGAMDAATQLESPQKAPSSPPVSPQDRKKRGKGTSFDAQGHLQPSPVDAPSRAEADRKKNEEKQREDEAKDQFAAKYNIGQGRPKSGS